MASVRARTVTLTLAVATGFGLTGCADGNIRAMPSVVGPVASLDAAPAAASRVDPAAPHSTAAVALGTVESPAAQPVIQTVAPIPEIQAGAKALTTGSRGANVAALEARLAELRFNPGKQDGVYDSPLLQAVMAFQKQQGLPRTGRADQATLTAVSNASLGAPAVPAGEATRVEVDIERQIAQFWSGGALVRVLPISSGNGERYCVPKDKGGGCDTAVTPGGSYRADRKIQGIRVSKLGTLYDPVYFNGGIAIHGSPSVPAVPASHGCIRVPMWESRWVHDTVAIGDPVYVVGGAVVPVPFGETAPDDGVEVTAPADEQ